MKQAKIHISMTSNIMRVSMLLLCISCLQGIQAQEKQVTSKVSGIVAEGTNKPLEFATVLLINKHKTSEVFSAASNKEGKFSLSVPNGEYHFELSFLGFEKYRRELQITADVELPEVTLSLLSNQLGEVIVLASPVTFNVDGFTLNIKNNPQFKGMLLTDILRTSPGLWLDDSGRLQVYDKSVAKVYINEREVKLSGKELIDYLRMFNEKTLRKIDVIASSGVEDDAASAGKGVLRITTDKADDGRSLLIGARAVVGESTLFYTPNVNMTFRQGKLSGYLMTNYFSGKSNTTRNTETLNYDANLSFNSKSKSINTTKFNVPVTVGLGYDFTPRSLISFEVAYRHADFVNENNINESRYADNVLTDNIFRTINRDRNNRNLNLSMNYLYLPQSGGRFIVKADRYSSNGHLEENDLSHFMAGENRLRSNKEDAKRENYVLSADYSKPLRDKNDVLEAGMKYSQIANENIVHRSGEDTYFDDFKYNESIYAAYAKYTLKYNLFTASAGLRVEYSEIDPRSQVTTDKNHKSIYTDLFPSISMNYTLNKQRGHNLNFSYRRSLERPYFASLNPGIHVESENFYTRGNPYLTPSYSNSIGFRSTFFNNYVLSISRGKSAKVSVNNTFMEDGVLYQQPQNMSSSEDWGIYTEGAFQLTRWWRLSATLSYKHSSLQYPDTLYKSSILVYSGVSVFSLPYGVKLTTQILGNTGSSWGNSKRTEVPRLDFFVSKSFLNNRLSLSINTSDILNSFIKNKTERYASNFYQMEQQKHPMTVGIGLTYSIKWGNKSAKISRVEAGNQEEQSRNSQQ